MRTPVKMPGTRPPKGMVWDGYSWTFDSANVRPFGNIAVLSETEQAARLTHCAPCEHNIEGRCVKCPACGGRGRPVAGFVVLSTHECPEKKWLAEA